MRHQHEEHSLRHRGVRTDDSKSTVEGIAETTLKCDDEMMIEFAYAAECHTREAMYNNLAAVLEILGEDGDAEVSEDVSAPMRLQKLKLLGDELDLKQSWGAIQKPRGGRRHKSVELGGQRTDPQAILQRKTGAKK